jgi:subtilisin family serine protease
VVRTPPGRPVEIEPPGVDGMQRRLLLLGAVGVLLAVSLTGASATTASEGVDKTKLSPTLAHIVAQGGYGDFDMAQFVQGYRAGDVYYLAEVVGDLGEAAAAFADAGATVRFRYPSINWVALVSPLDALARVSQLESVKRLDADRVFTVLQISTTPVAGVADQAKRGTSDIGADTLWAEGITGKGVLVGVADSGIDSLHPDLDDQDWRIGIRP